MTNPMMVAREIRKTQRSRRIALEESHGRDGPPAPAAPSPPPSAVLSMLLRYESPHTSTRFNAQEQQASTFLPLLLSLSLYVTPALYLYVRFRLPNSGLYLDKHCLDLRAALPAPCTAGERQSKKIKQNKKKSRNESCTTITTEAKTSVDSQDNQIL